MTRFIAFDVETPNRWNNRMSAIGITVIEEGKITESFCSLVDPLQPFDWFNTQLTGINEETVFGAPTFPELWPTIEPILSSAGIMKSNGKRASKGSALFLWAENCFPTSATD